MGNCCQSSETPSQEKVKGSSENPPSETPSSDQIKNGYVNKKRTNSSQKQQLIPDSEDEKLNISNQYSNNTSKNNTPNPDTNTSHLMALAEQESNDIANNLQYSQNNLNNKNHNLANEKIPLLQGPINNERYLVYKDKMIETIKTDDGINNVNIIKVEAKLPNNSEEKDDIIEQIIVTYKKGDDDKETNKNMEMTCSICFDDELTPSQLIEYTFDNERWFLANICPECNSYYRSTKFENWKHSIENETCEAAFRRMLNIGVITTLFDNVVFASPEEEKHLYQVKDHHGKTVQIPRPVSAMRIWDPSTNKYKDVRARLDGAPDSEEELQELWQGMVNTFKTKYGKDLVVSWMNASTPGGPDDMQEDDDLPM